MFVLWRDIVTRARLRHQHARCALRAKVAKTEKQAWRQKNGALHATLHAARAHAHHVFMPYCAADTTLAHTFCACCTALYKCLAVRLRAPHRAAPLATLATLPRDVASYANLCVRCRAYIFASYALWRHRTSLHAAHASGTAGLYAHALDDTHRRDTRVPRYRASFLPRV